MQHDLVAGLPARDARADLPHDPRGVGAADVVVLLGVVAEHRDGLAQGGPDVVVVDAGRHHAHDHLEGARLGNLDLLELEGVARFALALLPDDPCGHRPGQLSRLDVQLGDLLEIDRHLFLHLSRRGTGALNPTLGLAWGLGGARAGAPAGTLRR